MYDLALFTNEGTKKRHPGFLVHDNIFDAGKDTQVKSIEYLINQAKFDDTQQYILTLNSDRLEEDGIASHANLKLAGFEKAFFTKENQFLKGQYSEEK